MLNDERLRNRLVTLMTRLTETKLERRLRWHKETPVDEEAVLDEALWAEVEKAVTTAPGAGEDEAGGGAEDGDDDAGDKCQKLRIFHHNYVHREG